jgi:hypothetical protein
MKTSAFWSIVYGLFFVLLILGGLMWIGESRFAFVFVPVADMVIMTLAIFRLTRLATYDVITKFIRDAVGKAPPDSFVGTFSQLLNCPWCTGLWFSFFVLFAYYATPLAWPVILILALAGVASLVQVLGNFIGWSAEAKKRQVLSMGDSGSGSSCG